MENKISLTELEFLDHSNRIEDEWSREALEDAIEAWKFLKDNIITVPNILWTHRLLMARLEPDIAGKIRTCNVWIGGKKKTFVSQFLIEEDLDALCDRIQTTDEISILIPTTEKEEKTKELHIVFEDIHPFADGNGRVGRIIYNAHRLKLGLPIHVIHEGEEQENYYKWFTEQ